MFIRFCFLRLLSKLVLTSGKDKTLSGTVTIAPMVAYSARTSGLICFSGAGRNPNTLSKP